jgi:hypothetical protein
MSANISGTNLLRDNIGMARPMRNGPPVMTRPPGPGLAPIVTTATGLGAGGGVGVGGNSDAGWGHLRVFVGLAPAASGTIVLLWPVTPPAATGGLFFTADWATIVQTGTNPYTLTWTAILPLVTNKRPLRLAYEWRLST